MKTNCARLPPRSDCAWPESCRRRSGTGSARKSFPGCGSARDLSWRGSSKRRFPQTPSPPWKTTSDEHWTISTWGIKSASNGYRRWRVEARSQEISPTLEALRHGGGSTRSAGILGWPSGLHDSHKVVRQHHDFQGLPRIVHVDVAMRIRVLVGADCPSEELHSRYFFTVSRILVGQNSAIGFERFLHELDADTRVRESRGFPDENFDALHGLKHGDIEVATDECRPHLVRDPGMENLFRENSYDSGVCKLGFIFVLKRPSTQDVETVWAIRVRARDEHPLRHGPCPEWRGCGPARCWPTRLTTPMPSAPVSPPSRSKPSSPALPGASASSAMPPHPPPPAPASHAPSTRSTPSAASPPDPTEQHSTASPSYPPLLLSCGCDEWRLNLARLFGLRTSPGNLSPTAEASPCVSGQIGTCPAPCVRVGLTRGLPGASAAFQRSTEW